MCMVLSTVRPLSAEELGAAASVADAGAVIASQAFLTDAPEIAESLWFVPFRDEAGITAMLLRPPAPHQIQRGDIDCEAWRREELPSTHQAVPWSWWRRPPSQSPERSTFRLPRPPRASAAEGSAFTTSSSRPRRDPR